MRAQPLRFKKIAPNTQLIALSVVEGTMTQRKTGALVPNDIGIFQNIEGMRFRIPMREFLNFKLSDDRTISNYLEEFGRLPDKIMILKSSERTDKNGVIMYPIEAYVLAKEFLNEEINYQDLLNGGFSEGHKFDALQDYVIAVC